MLWAGQQMILNCVLRMSPSKGSPPDGIWSLLVRKHLDVTHADFEPSCMSLDDSVLQPLGLVGLCGWGRSYQRFIAFLSKSSAEECSTCVRAGTHTKYQHVIAINQPVSSVLVAVNPYKSNTTVTHLGQKKRKGKRDLTGLQSEWLLIWPGVSVCRSLVNLSGTRTDSICLTTGH